MCDPYGPDLKERVQCTLTLCFLPSSPSLALASLIGPSLLLLSTPQERKLPAIADSLLCLHLAHSE